MGQSWSAFYSIEKPVGVVGNKIELKPSPGIFLSLLVFVALMRTLFLYLLHHTCAMLPEGIVPVFFFFLFLFFFFTTLVC